MSKIYLLLLTFLLLFSLNSTPIYAQTNFEKTRTEYLFALENYGNAYEDYQTARNSYLKFKTLISKQEAYEKTKVYLTAVDNLLRVYLLMFRARVEEVPAQDPKQKELILAFIEKELIYLGEFQTTVNNTQLLEDFPKHAQNLNNHYNLYKQEAKKDILLLQVAQRRSIVNSGFEIIADLENQIQKAKDAGKNTNDVNRGPLEMRNLLSLAQQKINDAQKAAEGANQGKVIGLILETNNLILQTFQFAREVIRGLL